MGGQEVKYLARSLNRAVYCLMDYVPGISLTSMWHPEYAKRLCLPRDLGGILALDIFLNNNDRLPCPLWSNASGNPENLFFLESGQPVAIDTVCCPLDPKAMPERVERYWASVKEMVGEVRVFHKDGSSQGIEELKDDEKVAPIPIIFEPMRRIVWT